ncbi:MAG TPA: preprotein translocase subunit SecG [Candidatus Parcubacteria bacterium]|jgi:protein translocase SecG subunit|nr:preprotein translocase subunit SecG [Candidatus Parcubacteria bacterium]|tara:strand:- start:2 stop:232 length:231 start_codon:yes stop_codon:yes gene_type:complete
MDLATIIPWTQIVLSVVLTALVLFQSPDEGGLGALGGGDVSGGTHTKRGFEKTLFITTIVISILFGLLAIAVLVIS